MIGAADRSLCTGLLGGAGVVANAWWEFVCTQVCAEDKAQDPLLKGHQVNRSMPCHEVE
jgi:hypothetical protein